MADKRYRKLSTPEVTMTELMLGLLLWIGANTDYTVTTALPNIVMTGKYNMCV